MALNRRHFSSKEDIPKEGDEGGGSDEGGGGDGGNAVTTSNNKDAKDEVDFVLTASKANGASGNGAKNGQEDPGTKTGVTLDKFNIFHLRRRPKSDPGTGPIAKHAAAQGTAGAAAATAMGRSEETLKKKKSRFVKSASIARIFGNTYNTKKYDDSSALLKLQQFKRSFLNSEKFHKKDSGAGAAEETELPKGELQIGDACYVNDSESSAKAIKSITRGLGRLLRRNCHSIDISRPDPEYKVSYLGNVLTGWAKDNVLIILLDLDLKRNHGV
uniref:Uncharacterized protein n=1 Tax=Anopheles farauti TaxID=69004 RepID=A0A182Q7S0_9DIPT